MKLSLMRPALVLAAALSLASCGGKAGFTISGEVSGLQYSGLELSTNGMKVKVEPAGGTPIPPVKFAFPNEIEYGEAYDVTIAEMPLNQTCSLDNTASNTAGRLSVINVTVQCALRTNSVSGTVTGLTGSGLQLTNGSLGGTTTVVASTTGTDPTFTFANIPFGQPYGITVLTQPTGQICTISGQTVGYMDNKGITGLVVDCK